MHYRNFLVKNNANRVCFKGYLEVTIQSGLKTRSRQPNEPAPLWGYCFQIWWELRALGRFDGKEAKYFVLRLQQLRGRPGGHIKDNRKLKILYESDGHENVA